MLSDFFIGMPKILIFFIVCMAAFSFGHAVQSLRNSLPNVLKDLTNRKPFNCIYCLSFWFTLSYIVFSIISKSVEALVFEYIVIVSFACSGCVHFLVKISQIIEVFISEKEIDTLLSKSSEPNLNKTED